MSCRRFCGADLAVGNRRRTFGVTRQRTGGTGYTRGRGSGRMRAAAGIVSSHSPTWQQIDRRRNGVANAAMQAPRKEEARPVGASEPRRAEPQGICMTTFGSSDGSCRLGEVPPTANAVDTPSRKAVFSWKRILRLLACVLSIAWVVMLHVSTANSGGLGLIAPTFWPKIVTALITIAAMLPILLFVRGRLMYVLGLPFLFLSIWTVWALLATLGITYPGIRMPH